MKLVKTWRWLLLVVMCISGTICQNDQHTDFFNRVMSFVTNATGSLPTLEEAENIPQQVFGANSRNWFQNLVPKPGDDYIASCGGMSTSEKTIWQNSEYPKSEDIPGLCSLNLLPPAGTCAFRIHFQDMDLMPKRDYDAYYYYFPEVCPASQKSFKATTPDDLTATYCQKLDGYEGILHVSDTTQPTILLLQVDPSAQFKFKVSVTAVNCNDIKTYESPANCGIKNQDLATLRAELFGVGDLEESQDSVVSKYEVLPLEVRQNRRNPVDSNDQIQDQKNKNKNKHKKNDKDQNKKGTADDEPFDIQVIKDLNEGIKAAVAAGKLRNQSGGDRVVGQQTTLINEWPWIVYIETRINGFVDRPSCNGLLLDNSKVLTSRDCVLITPQQPYGVENMFVTIGDHDIDSTTEANSKTVTVSRVTMPLKNNFYDTKDAFAVLHLSEKVELSETIRPICLPVSYNKFDDSGVVSGWDFSYVYQPLSFPQEAKVKLTDKTVCNETLHEIHYYYNNYGPYEVNFDIDDVLCAGEKKYSTGVVCSGESGSSLVQRDRRGAYYVTGVAGMLNDCYYIFPTVFSKIEPDNQFLNIALA